MKYITIDELNIRKFNSIIQAASEDNNLILTELEDMAISEISIYLNGKYDTELIFNQTGTHRNPTIKRMLIDFILCYLFERVSSNEIPEYLSTRCETNKKLLMEFATGKIDPGLPKRDEKLEGRTGFKYGSNPPIIDSKY